MKLATRSPAPRLTVATWWLAAAWTLASTADSFLLFVLLWIAEPQGWSGTQTAVLVIAMRLPTLAGGILGGRAVDRFGPVPMMLLDGMVRTALMGGLIIAGIGGTFDLRIVLALGAAAGVTAPLSYAAARTLVPRLAPPESLAKANALLSVGDQLPMLLGAILTGPALALLGTGTAFVLPLLMMLGVTALAIRLRNAPQYEQTPAPQGVRSRGTRRSTRVIGLIALSVAYYFTYGPYETVLPYYVREQLTSGLGGYTLLWALFGTAALLTLPTAAALSRHRPGLVNAAGAIVWGVVMLPLAFTDHLVVAAIGFAAAGAIWGPYSAVETTALHRWTDPADHGRIFGTQRALLALAAPLGAAVGAVAADHFPPAPILAASAIGCTLAGLGACAIPDLRRR
ncbi:putative MFS family arabinose efflux permease [Kribbella voronezhensis]|uniref:Putative MFS family arabinose efflux permease n=1 Tax=Kribbella voronezhensis TaxID=2512212 RepID=A0A4R7T8K9_9ACTN|nr:MFS transporter [Kribbella voronezhensis]TDU87999.1 putative MFS family arabinose efflux permease [Kribbella voronezhensis]